MKATAPRDGSLPARGFGQTKKNVGLHAQHLAELENAAAGDLLPTICLDGEVSDLAAQFTVAVFGFLDIASHTELPEELSTELLPVQEIPGLCVGDMAKALQPVQGGLTGGSRVEQLANNFAAAVLMPADTLARFGGWSELGEAALVAQLNAAATELHVTASALKWRLVAVGALTSATARAVPDVALRHNGRSDAESQPPALFSRPFLEVLGLSVREGLVSIRRAATLLELSIDDLSDLFAVHGVAQPAEL